jgi:hypothetical protein
MRLQCRSNKCRRIAEAEKKGLAAIRRKSLLPKVGLEPTPPCGDRILSPKIGVFVELDLRFDCVESLVRNKI